jgi:hypothetical protein
MPDERRIHVTKHDDGWAVKREGAERAIEVNDTKAGAIDIHKQKRNEIQEERTYRKDPYPPRG